MGHNILHRNYPQNVDKKEVQRDLDNYAAHEGWQEGVSGLSNPIRWVNFICDSYDDALAYIESHDNGWYDQLAVMYRVAPKKNEKAMKLEAAEKAAYQKYAELGRVLYVNTVTSAFIGCKRCGSKLNRTYIKKNTCPLCGEDFRSDTTKSRIQAAKKKWESAKQNLDGYLRSESQKSKEIRWLVKVEYHT